MAETGTEEARSPTEIWTEEVVGLAKEAVVTFFEHGPSSEQHRSAAEQLWTALEVLATVQQALQADGADVLKSALSALDRKSEWKPPSSEATNCARCGRALTPDALAQGQTECSSHKPGKVEIRRPRIKNG